MTDILSSISNLEEKEFTYLKDIVYKETGIFLAAHKRIMLQSRLNIRLRINKIVNFEKYVHELKSSPSFYQKEILEIINRVTTNKTDFFRENHHFEYLKNKYLPEVERNTRQTYSPKKLRFWCSACSTGEEPYSLAIVLREFFQGKSGWDIKIYASDIDTNVLQTASEGVYKQDRMATIRRDLLAKYFVENNDSESKTYTAKADLKSLIQFQKLNLLQSPLPIHEKIDVIFCRNVIIYFDKPTQQKLFAEISRVMQKNGILIIGHSETLFGISDNFKFLGQTIYQKNS
ncbi:MAG: protein-glutamate O-methyltransferase CheR [Spirochaetota bacterium]